MQPLITSDNLINFASGEIVAGYRNVHTEEFTPAVHKNNLITYGGADILAKLMAGDARYAISAMYFKFKNTAGDTGNDLGVTRGASVGDFLSIDGSDYTDWLRVPIITSAKIDSFSNSSESIYAGNRVTFVATTASVKQEGMSITKNTFGENADSNSPSKIYSLALVATPDKYSNNSDIIFARTQITPITAIPDNYIDVFWTITFF